MRAVIAAGGTAGHINPALAIAAEIIKKEPDSEIIFAGRNDGMERRLVANVGYEFHHFEIHGFERSLKPQNVIFNINSIKCALRSSIEARRFFAEFNPDVVIGCGGYISGPIVREAAKLGIHTAIQEQNSFPGVTTKLLAKYVDVICCATEDGAERLGYSKKTYVTGNPVRPEFFTTNREDARERLKVGDRVCILSFGGSLGAKTMNELAAQIMREHWQSNKIFHIHATGQYATESFPKRLNELGVDANSPNISVRDYIYDMPECFAAADLVISRSGAISISELAAAGRASVLVPSPNVAENHQYYNALTLSNIGAARLYEENGLNFEKASVKICELASDRVELRKMGESAHSIAIKNSAEEIYCHIKEILN